MRASFLSIAIIVFGLLPGAGRSDERPVDPYLCIAPVPYGEIGSTRAVGVHPHPRHVQFIPGYPTPIFFGHGMHGAYYINPSGRIHPHPRPDPGHFDSFYAGADGTVFWWDHAGRALFFDRARGHFRPIAEASDDEHAELGALRAALEGKGSAGPVRRRLGWGEIRNRRSRAVGRQRMSRTDMAPREAWQVEAPGLGIAIEGRGDQLRLTRDGRRVEHVVPGLSPYTWHLTELPRSGRAVLTSLFESRMLVIDTELNLSRPEGEWQLPRHPELLLLPETGEALVRTSLALFWLRDRRISGRDACGNVEPPPLQQVRRIRPEGTKALIRGERDRAEGFWPSAATGTVLVHSAQGLFRLFPDNVLRRVGGSHGHHYSRSWHIPGTDRVMVGMGPGFAVVDDSGIVFQSASFEPECCFEGEPILRNPSTGSILLNDGRYLTRDWKIRTLEVPGPDFLRSVLRPAAASTAWLPDPLVGGFVWGENDELRLLGIELSPPPDDRRRDNPVLSAGFWLDFERFGFLATILRGWRKLDADLKLVPMPGQPEAYVDTTHLGRPNIDILDPGAGDVLLGLPEGLWAVDAAGAMRRVTCADGCAYGYVTSLASVPGAQGEAIVGAQGGLFRYHPAAGGTLRRIAAMDRTGAVIRLHAVPWRKMVLIEAALGNFTWAEGAGLRLLDIEVDTWFMPRFVVTEAPDRVFARSKDLVVLEFPDD